MNRKLAIGCGVALALFIIGVCALVVLLPKLIRKGVDAAKNIMAEEQRLTLLENGWLPPAGTLNASWFPEQVGEWKLVSQKESPGIARFDIARAGRHGEYRSHAGVVEVDVMAANDLEKDALFSRVQKAPTNGAAMSSWSGHRGYMRLNGDDYTRVWWVPAGWLFVFHSQGSDPKEFEEPYLKAIDAAASSAAPASATPEPAVK